MSNGDNIDLGIYDLDDSSVINIGSASASSSSNNQNSKSVNFGGGIELLMNNKSKKTGSSNPSSDIDVNDLDDLENELNDLADDIDDTKYGASNIRSSFNRTYHHSPKDDNNTSNLNNIKLKFDNDNDNDNDNNDDNQGDNHNDNTQSNKPSFTKSLNKNMDSTWDGYKKFNDIPVDPNKNVHSEPRLSNDEKNRKKREYLKKLDILKKKGVKLSKEYTIDSTFEDVEDEYNSIIAEKERHNSVKFQGKMMMAMITGLEYLNNRFDPFDLKLDGWAESVGENIDDYDEIFAELHEKYKSKAKMAPELKLLFQLGGSAVMLHMTNTMFKSAMPGMEDIMRQNPELMQQFTQAAVNTMGQSNPGFGNFMNGMMGGSGGGGNEPQTKCDVSNGSSTWTKTTKL
jgi:hypothetical protein